MDAKEVRFTFGFLLLGLAPIIATAAGAGVGALICAAGLLISISTAFA